MLMRNSSGVWVWANGQLTYRSRNGSAVRQARWPAKSGRAAIWLVKKNEWRIYNSEDQQEWEGKESSGESSEGGHEGDNEADEDDGEHDEDDEDDEEEEDDEDDDEQ
ncbi:hypothetical protein LTR49_027159 [Elasticomyces elasticus]|nr:hypothetical protein LTR49_027159 [Elasticomyces elasticus]